MAQKNVATFKASKNSRYADNTSGSVSAGDSRDMFEDTADSFLNITDHLLDEDDMASNSATKVPSQQSVKAYVDGKVGGAMLSVTKTISTAEILSGNTSPVTVLAAQGAGTVIHIVSPIVWKWNYATAAFATNTTSRMYINSNGLVPITNNNSVISLASVRIELLQIIDVDHTTANIENAPIVWQVSTGDPTGGGTSTLKVHFKYFVETL